MQEPEALTQSRTERFRGRASRRRRIVGVVLAAAVVLAVAVAGIGLFVRGHDRSPSTSRAAISRFNPAAPVVRASVVSTSAPGARVEVPELAGMTVREAGTILKAAGLVLHVSLEGTAEAPSDVVVGRQSPDPGAVVGAGSAVTVLVPSFKPARVGTKVAASSKKKPSRHYVVVIDPGHQSRADDTPEPIGPGSLEQKPRMTAGVTGAASQVPEYEIALEVATNLKARLEAAGVRVVMTRTTNDVDLSNVERAQMANASHADIFVRIHTDNSPDGSVTGVSTLYPASNQWTKPIFAASRRAAAEVEQHLVDATGAQDGGSVARSDIAGFNWSKVPAVLVQTGFQSNGVEDRLLASAHYQDEIADGLASGILAYLGASAR